VPDGEVILRPGADIIVNDAPVALLDHILIDPSTGRMSHLVVEELRTGRKVIVPAEWVSEMHENLIVLHTWNPLQAGVPDYRPRSDAELTKDVREALKGNPELDGVQADVQKGVANLQGEVDSVEAKADAEARARSVNGIVGVNNALSLDTALFGRITAALADDPDTADIPIEVIVDRGIVTLEGVVPSFEIRAKAEQIARQTPGVVTVINDLEAGKSEPEDVHVVPPTAFVQH
jgi:osmotically-inducible protein OsmY